MRFCKPQADHQNRNLQIFQKTRVLLLPICLDSVSVQEEIYITNKVSNLYSTYNNREIKLQQSL